MISEPLPERHRELLAESRERLARVPTRAVPALPGTEGTLYTLAATAAFPLEWLVVERSAEGAGMAVVVPADTQPAEGMGDVALPPTAALGPLTLRTAWAIPLPAALFPPHAATGALEPELLAEVKARLPEGHARGAASPELLGWAREVLAPAIAAAERAARPERAAAVRARRPPPGALPWMALAAGLAALAAGALVWSLDQRAKGAMAVAAAPAPSVNPTFLYLAPQGTLRAEPPASAELGATDLVVVLQLPALEHAATYDLDLLRSGEAHPSWHRTAVPVEPASEIRLLLPAGWLRAGRYRLRALPSGGARPALTFAFELTGAAPPAP